MRILLFLLLACAVFSCKPDGSSSGVKTTPSERASQLKKTTITKEEGMKSANEASSSLVQKESEPRTTRKGNVETNFNKNGIPDACDLLKEATIAKYLGIPAESINLADGSSSKSQLQRACFFKWDGTALKNAGVMVQIQQNPVADDVPEYFTYMVQSLKKDGENSLNGGNTKFYDWPGFGDDGAYSTEAGKYVWRVGNDWAFMVAFNTELKGKDQERAAKAFAQEVMDRMTF